MSLNKQSWKKISVVLPCRNEEETIGVCIDKIKRVLKGRNYEIIVSDSSKDKSPKIAKKKGAIVVKHDKVGYGNAYLEGFKKITGDVVVIGDADDTYDFLEIPKLLPYIEKYDFVMGQRKYLKKGSMPLLHKYIGNPLLSFMLRLFFGAKVKDTHCGFRIIRKSALDDLKLRTTGMEFASEMIIKAVKNKLRIKDVPIHYYPRIGESKLSSFRDGWRHIRFMLLYSPAHLFFLPGAIIFLLGMIGMLLTSSGTSTILGFNLGIHTLVFSTMLTILGFQLIFLTLFAKVFLFAVLKEKNSFLEKLTNFLTFEKGIMIGGVVSLLGMVVGLTMIINWISSDLKGFFNPELAIVASTITILGVQLVFNVFYLSILGIERK
jgi:glycosyltransferase involved in cell wall biosynthesis